MDNRIVQHCGNAQAGPPYTREQCRVAWLYLNDDRYRQLWSGSVPPLPALPSAPDKEKLPCRHLGPATGQVLSCSSCQGRVRLKVLTCAVHAACTTMKPVAGTACCSTCPDHEPDTFHLVAPLGTADQSPRWEGRTLKRPWQYRVTCLLPHLGPLDLLETCIALLRQQTEPVYLVVVDTGSPPDVCRELEKLRAADLEIHYVRSNGYRHSSEPVAVALDLGMARVNTELIFLTHEDCFVRRRDAVAWLAGQCSAACPVVGWQMSPRDWITDQWQGMVSHTFTMLHAPTMRRIGASWHMQKARDLLGMTPPYQSSGWPDTETALGMILRQHDITPKLLGDEPNYVRHKTDFFDHARSLPGTRAYLPGTSQHQKAEIYGAAALADARRRLQEWTS